MKKISATTIIICIAILFSISAADWYGSVKKDEGGVKGAYVRAIDCILLQHSDLKAAGGGGGYQLGEEDNMVDGKYYSLITAYWDNPFSVEHWAGYTTDNPDTFRTWPHATGLDINITYPPTNYNCD